MDASRRSSKGNAFFTGFGKRKRIALFDTLIQRSPVDELVAVLAHEVGHYKKRHVLIGTAASALETGLFLGLFSVFLHQQGLFTAFGVDTPGIWTGIIFVSVLLQPVELVLSIGGAALSRRHERQADRFALATTGRGDLLASGLKRLSKDNLSNLTPHPVLRVPRVFPSAHAGTGEGAGSGAGASRVRICESRESDAPVDGPAPGGET